MPNIAEWIKQLEPLNRTSRKAVVQLIEAGTEAVAPLIQILEKGNVDQKIQAARILGKIGDQHAVEPLTRALADKNYYVRSAAETALYRLRAVEPLIQHLRTATQKDLPVYTLWTLEKLADSRAVPILLEKLDQVRPENLVFYYQALAAIAPDTLRPYLKHPNARLRSAAGFALLGSRPAPDKLDIITALLHDEKADIRQQAVLFLLNIRSIPQIPDLLIEALRDPSAKVRAQAAYTIGAWKRPEIIAALIDRLIHDPDVNTRRQVAYTLAHFAAPEAGPALIQALQDPDRYVKNNAVLALGKIRERRALKPLLELLPLMPEEDRQLGVRALAQLKKRRLLPLLLQEAAAGYLRGWEAIQELVEMGGETLLDPMVEILHAADLPARETALQTLVRLGILGIQKEAILAAVAPLADDPDPGIRRQLAMELRNWPLPESLAVLAVLLKDPDDSIRRHAAFALEKQRHPAAVPLLIEALEDKNEWVCAHVIHALGRLKSREAVIPLLRLLQSDISGNVQAAAAALGRIGDPRAVEPLQETARNAPLAPAYPDLYAAEALTRFRDPHILPLLLEMLHESACNDDEQGIQIIAHSLATLQDQRAVEPLFQLFQKDVAPEAVIEALSRLGDRRIVEPILKKLPRAKPEDYHIGIMALSRLAAPEAMEVLTNAMHESDPTLRHAAFKALGRIGDPRSLPLFLEALHTAPYSLRRFAVAGLIKIGAPAVEPLITLLQSNAPPVIRARAAGVLGHIGDSRAVEPLRTALYDPDRHVRIRARHALRQMERET